MNWSLTVKRNIGALKEGQVFRHFGTEYTRESVDPVNKFIKANFGKHTGHVIFHPETVVVVPRDTFD